MRIAGQQWEKSTFSEGCMPGLISYLSSPLHLTLVVTRFFPGFFFPLLCQDVSFGDECLLAKVFQSLESCEEERWKQDTPDSSSLSVFPGMSSSQQHFHPHSVGHHSLEHPPSCTCCLLSGIPPHAFFGAPLQGHWMLRDIFQSVLLKCCNKPKVQKFSQGFLYLLTSTVKQPALPKCGSLWIWWHGNTQIAA